MTFQTHWLARAVTLFLGLCLSCSARKITNGTHPLNLSFGMLNGGGPFFEPVALGFEQKCKSLGVTCYLVGPERGPCGKSHNELVADFLYNKSVDGIVMRPCKNETEMRKLIDLADSHGVPVVTFDLDVPNSTRSAYVGTDNEFLGRTMAKLLRQLRQEGGTFTVIAPKSGDQGESRYRGFYEEITRYNDDDNRPNWNNITAPNYTAFDRHAFMAIMEDAALMNPTALLIMTQTPMRHENWTLFVDKHRHRNITIIGTDGSDYQLDYLNRRYVDGLVGQLPYEWGTLSLQTVYDRVLPGQPQTLALPTNVPTNVLAFNLIPIELPLLNVDENRIGDLRYVGIICVTLIFIAALACAGWTVYFRASDVVQIAQPFFLLMVAGGVLLLGSAIIPLSIDDDGSDMWNDESKHIGICMSVPWLACIGFVVTFSALFAKTWRVNRLLEAQQHLSRITVTEKDVLWPFSVLLISNILILSIWTILDPLTYVRQENEGTDYWNRVISSYGACRSENSAAYYLVPLLVINLSLVAFACWQAFQARQVDAEFAEAKFIALAVSFMFQAFLTGGPILVVSKDDPTAFYLLLTLILFTLSMVILLLIFVPKVVTHRRFTAMTPREQKREISRITSSGSSRRISVHQGIYRSYHFTDKDIVSNKSETTDNTLSRSISGSCQISQRPFKDESQTVLGGIAESGEQDVVTAIALRSPENEAKVKRLQVLLDGLINPRFLLDKEFIIPGADITLFLEKLQDIEPKTTSEEVEDVAVEEAAIPAQMPTPEDTDEEDVTLFSEEPQNIEQQATDEMAEGTTFDETAIPALMPAPENNEEEGDKEEKEEDV